MGKYQPYPDYRDSGVPFLGQIPSNWKAVRTKFVANLVNEKVEPDAGDRFIGLENVSSWTGRYLERGEASKPEGISSRYYPDCVLFGKLRPYLAKSLRVSDQGICSSEFLVLRSRKVISHFLQYFTLTDEFICHVDSSTYGAKMPRASWEFIGSIPIPVPSAKEQEIIVDFLDHETTKIDRLIARQVRLIELLKEKRQAVISHAVTKGINPDAPMKGSGVEWLGVVPAHWTVSQVGFMSKLIQTGPFGSQLHAEDYVDGGIPVINPANIQAGEIVPDEQVTVDEATAKILQRHQLIENEIIFARRGELGRCALVTTNEKGWICGTGSLKISLNTEKVEPAFVAIFLGISGVKDELSLSSKGSTMENLNTEILSRVTLACPEKDEQLAILDYLSETGRKLGQLLQRAEDAVDLLKEHRTALISAAVTGKIDVRGWQKPNTEPQAAATAASA